MFAIVQQTEFTTPSESRKLAYIIIVLISNKKIAHLLLVHALSSNEWLRASAEELTPQTRGIMSLCEQAAGSLA